MRKVPLEYIGRLKMQLKWLKKKLTCSCIETIRCIIEPIHPDFSVA